MANEGFKLTTTNRRIVDEVPWGTYVFRCEDGEYLGDGDDRLMCHAGYKGDREIIKKMWEAAKYYLGDKGVEGGSVEFWPGQRPVSDEEYAEQEMRQRAGLIPDPLDYGAHMDELKAKKKYG